MICHWPRSSILHENCHHFSQVCRDDDDVEWTLLLSCFALQMQPKDIIRAGNSVNLKRARPIDAKRRKKWTASDRNDLGEVVATQSINISSLFLLFLSNYYFFLHISFGFQKTSKSCLKLKRYGLFCFVLFLSFSLKKIDSNWIILITCIDFYE